MPDSNVLSQGIEFYNQKKYSDALTFFLTLSSETGADSLDVAYYLGLCYAKLSRYEDSLLYLEQVVTAGKDEDRVLQCRLILAVIYSLSGRKRLAAFELNKLLEAEYKPASVYAALAFVAWEQSDTEKCLDYYEKSLDADPENVTALNGMGYVLACEDKDLTKALSFCKKAVKASPNSAACLDSLGWVYYKLGLYDDAKKYLEMAEAIDGNNEEIANHIKSVVLDGDKR
ncbi:MAG: tetratricopeptide repeat protein [Treponema porcinum]|uniref:tetratricopeptide repeat protein n=1 Tax=Treponema porcinum TaxID=261392 RepID=UPI002355B193|nr:tetratricopeptide repeat protein [Treponema porcinum]MCI5645476.1 tetratricopeptide repeat protein [Treponema porcinum]MCI6180042.1 tetratricopeptide repeat protein [Treponema porcinum]MCI6722060.1 tetratricopeptide repeat protein [Treponema porcinum]MCI6984061.1 tetratricopeptide repeat protein [Treponema porcinum]MCI7115810.1 tetratricopeptide repeat protein [Treponema porcinum]